MPLMLDVVASLVAKFQPVSDCIHLYKVRPLYLLGIISGSCENKCARGLVVPRSWRGFRHMDGTKLGVPKGLWVVSLRDLYGMAGLIYDPALLCPQMLNRIMSREGVHGANAKVNPTAAPMVSKDNAAYSRIVLRGEADKATEVTPMSSVALPDAPLANEAGVRGPIITDKTVLVSGLRATSDGAIVGGVRGLVNAKDEVVADRYRSQTGAERSCSDAVHTF